MTADAMRQMLRHSLSTSCTAWGKVGLGTHGREIASREGSSDRSGRPGKASHTEKELLHQHLWQGPSLHPLLQTTCASHTLCWARTMT